MATKRKTTKAEETKDEAPEVSYIDWLIHELAKSNGWTDVYTKDWSEQKYEQSKE